MNSNHATADAHPKSANTTTANDGDYFPPITVAIGRRVPNAKGALVPQPTHSAAEHITFNNIDELAAALTAHDVALPDTPTKEDRADVKRRVPYYVIGGLANGGSPEPITPKESKRDENKIYRRLTGNIGAASLIPLDIDECSRAAFELLTGGESSEFNDAPSVLDAFQAIAYTTPSHSPEAPRFRVLAVTNSPVAPADKGRVCRQLEAELMRRINAQPLPPVVDESGKVIPRLGHYQLPDDGGVIKFDASVYADNQVIYLPANNGTVLIYEGEPVALDRLPELAPEALAVSRSTGKGVIANAPEELSDAAAWLLDSGLAEEHDAKTLNILCPFSHEHGDGGGVINNSTVFIMDADPRAERFNCSHDSCKHRMTGETGLMLAYARALGMPEDVAFKQWGSTAHTDEFQVIANAAGELAAAGDVKPDPHMGKSTADSEVATLITRHLPGAALNLESDDFYRYQDDPTAPAFGTWQHWRDNRLKGFTASVFDLYKAPFSTAKLNAVVNMIRVKAQRMEPPAPQLIGFANGVYNLQTGVFSEHRPSNWLTSTNGIFWTEPEEGEELATHAPAFANLLGFITYDDEQKARSVMALLYAVLTRRYEWQKFYELTGPGGSGKGTIMQLCELLAGKENAVAIETELLDTARGRAPLVNATLITLPDQKQYMGDGNGLRGITGGDSLLIDPKNKHPFSMVIRAIVVAANNSPMRFTEQNGGIARRRVIFHFARVVREADRDRDLMPKLAAELPVIVRHLLKMFPHGAGAEAALIAQMNSADAVAIKVDTDPLTHFASMLDYGKEPTGLALGIASARKDDNACPEQFAIYSAYEAFCAAIGGKPLGLIQFRNNMKQAASTNGAAFSVGNRRNIKGTAGRKETPTNVIGYKPELAEYAPNCFGEFTDLSVNND